MKKNPYRAVLIWAVLAVALINIVPTVGWMMTPSDERFLGLSPEEQAETEPAPGTREWKLRMWRMEDDERAKERQSAFSDFVHTVKRWSEFDREHVINLGLDLQGGIHMVLGFDWEDLPDDRKQAYFDEGFSGADIEDQIQQSILQKITRRANEFDAREPIIQALGRNQIQIQLPGERDIERARTLITMTAQLDFHLVAEQDQAEPVWRALRQAFPEEFDAFISTVPGEFTRRVDVANFERVRDLIQRAKDQGLIPANLTVNFSQAPKAWQPQEYQLYVLESAPMASGEGLRESFATPDTNNPPYWQILFNFNSEAGQQFGEVTSANIGRPMAIVVDGYVLSAPTIRARITTSGSISGDFDPQDASDLAIALNSGSMTVPLYEEFTNVIGPTLGADSVRAGVISGALGICIVAVFMMLYYTSAGVIAVLGLLINALLIVAAMAYFNMTLTLPGIAGLILTIGMAVDANVLIYERIREELKNGHTMLSSVENAFSRAAVTILDANVTTLIAAALLYQFGTGPIEGFAVTLSVGVMATLFTSLVITRALFDFVVGKRWLKDIKMLSLIKGETSIPFLNMRKEAAMLSAATILIGLAFFGYRAFNGTMFGVDFTQGTNVHVHIESDDRVPVGDVRVALSAAGFTSPIVQEAGEGVGTAVNRFIIRVGDVTERVSGIAPVGLPQEEAAPTDEATPVDETVPTEIPHVPTETVIEPAEPAAASSEAETLLMTSVAERIQESLAPLAAGGSIANVVIDSEQTVGPAAGAQLRNDAMLAMFWAIVFIVIYISFRFELKFAFGAVAALVHDVLVTVGILALLGRQISMPTVAAVLTIIGYSLNDTIVIFDRVREDLQVYRGKGHKFSDILNISMNNTLSRTIVTSVTTLFVVVVLLIFGGDALRDFALALAIGIIVGTYSTIFVANPVVLAWHNYRGQQLAADSAGGIGRSRSKKKPKGDKPKGDKPTGAPA